MTFEYKTYDRGVSVYVNHNNKVVGCVSLRRRTITVSMIIENNISDQTAVELFRGRVCVDYGTATPTVLEQFIPFAVKLLKDSLPK